MPKGYWIGHVDVHSPEDYPGYQKAAQAAYEKYGARFLVRGGHSDVVEGASRARHVVVEFDTIEQARACYQSAEYQQAAKIRQANAVSDIIIVEGNG
ncbi:MAG: DUF1330 domain-containing protein [Pseudomonadota bacterium]